MDTSSFLEINTFSQLEEKLQTMTKQLEQDSIGSSLKKASRLTDGEWKLFCDDTIYRLTNEYVAKVQILVFLFRKYFGRYRAYKSSYDGKCQEELILQQREESLSDLSSEINGSIKDIKVWCPVSRFIGYYWLQHLLTEPEELLRFLVQLSMKIDN
jgi:hypothetical protein